MQTSNGSAPTSDWDQGYGYQFWRSLYNSFRGDGAFGQYCMVIPELDAVVVITSGVRDMQKVMNLVWDKLLPAMKPGRLPENATARRQLESRLAGLTVKLPRAASTSSLAASVDKTGGFIAAILGAGNVGAEVVSSLLASELNGK